MASQKILIVDDSRTIRMQVKDMLPKGNYEIFEAKDGLEGLDLITQEQPNLVLLDFFMPRMNGWEVVQKIQADPKLQMIPIVMMSGRREDVEKSVPELFDYFEFVGKPFEQALLFKAIKAATTKAKNRRLIPVPSSSEPSTPSVTPSGSSASDELEFLKAEIRQLHDKNAKLQAELDATKKQVAQILTFIRQKLK